MTTCGETGFGDKKTKRNRISVFRSANRFVVYRLQHYEQIKTTWWETRLLLASVVVESEF